MVIPFLFFDIHDKITGGEITESLFQSLSAITRCTLANTSATINLLTFLVEVR